MDKTYSEQNYVKKQIGALVAGEVLLHPIFRSDGLMLINQHRVLNLFLIDKIRKQMPSSASVLVATSPQEFEHFQKNTVSNAGFRQDLIEIMKEYGEEALKFQYADYEQINTNGTFLSALTSSPCWIMLDDILESDYLKTRAGSVKAQLLKLFTTDQTFIDLCKKINGYDDIILIHTINTLCIALLIGFTLELTNEELVDLSIAALFVHVGYTELPKEEFKSFLKAQGYDHPAMKKHFEAFLSKTVDSPYLRRKPIILGVLDHHEFYNGNGYPKGKKGEEISLFGRILHISHAYDSLVGGYDYTAGLSPLEALQIVYENKEGMFDYNILHIFLYRTTYFKLGSVVTLPNGRRAKIIGFENYVTSPHLPIVELENGRVFNLLHMSFSNG